MVVRTATCRCGQLRAICTGEAVRVSACHCLECQKRSGSAFAVQARWPSEKIEITGEFQTWERVADSGHRATYQFCPICGVTLAYIIEGWTGVTAIPVGAFADPRFPAPRFSVYEHRKHDWVDIGGEDVRHSETPSSKRKPGMSLNRDGKAEY
ncbi:MAG: GFA family protein [Pseudomonadota bacterium]